MKQSIRIARMALVVRCLLAGSHIAVAQDQQVTDGPTIQAALN